jgi:hypothetical protein
MCLHPTGKLLIPLFILFRICGSVRLCTLFVILCELPEGGRTPWLKYFAEVRRLK